MEMRHHLCGQRSRPSMLAEDITVIFDILVAMDWLAEDAGEDEFEMACNTTLLRNARRAISLMPCCCQ